MFDTEKFIHAIKCRQAIYNPKCEGYSIKEVKQTKWQEIADVMYKDWASLSADKREQRLRELNTKWRSIRDHFVKELRLTKSGNHKKKRKYIFYDELKFLLPTIENKQCSRAVSDSENETLVMDVVSELDESAAIVLGSGASNISVEMDDADEDASRTAYIDDSNGRHDNLNSYDENNGHANDTADVGDLLEVQQHVDAAQYSAGVPPHEDPDYNAFEDTMGNEAFLMSLLPILNKLPLESVMDVRIEIMQTLQRYSAVKSESL